MTVLPWPPYLIATAKLLSMTPEDLAAEVRASAKRTGRFKGAILRQLRSLHEQREAG